VALQRELAGAIAESGVRVLGPNCLGMISLPDRAVPTFSSALDEDVELRDGPVAFVSQSGAFRQLRVQRGAATGHRHRVLRQTPATR